MSQSQWLTSLKNVSDWLTPEQAENKSLVGLKNQSSSISAHPLFMGKETSVVGLETVGEEMTVHSRFVATAFTDLSPDQATPMSVWLSLRGTVSDWLTNTQTELKNLVTLQQQNYSIAAHPLFMAVNSSVVGLKTVAREMTLHSRFWEVDRYELAAQTGASRDNNMEDLWDMLATEDNAPLCTEDTGEPLGITVGGQLKISGPPATAISIAGQPGPGISLVLPITNAGALIGAITVTTAGGVYTGTLYLGGPDQFKFALSNGGKYPCSLLVGASALPAGPYNISLTAVP